MVSTIVNDALRDYFLVAEEEKNEKDQEEGGGKREGENEVNE